VRISLLGLALSLVICTDALPALAQNRTPASGTTPAARPQGTVRRGDAESERLERLAAEVVRTTREYRASLERMLVIYQRDVESFTDLVEVRRDLLQREIVSKRELEIAERLLAETQAKVAETERWIQDADKIIGEAAVHSEIAKLPPLPVGGYLATSIFIRFNGSASFSLADVPRWSASSRAVSGARCRSARSARATPTTASASITATRWTWPSIPIARRAWR
jgi:hypothetical protein